LSVLVGAPLAATPQRSLIRPAATAASGYRQGLSAGTWPAPGLRPVLLVTLVPITEGRAQRPVAAGRPALPDPGYPANRGVYAEHR